MLVFTSPRSFSCDRTSGLPLISNPVHISDIYALHPIPTSPTILNHLIRPQPAAPAPVGSGSVLEHPTA